MVIVWTAEPSSDPNKYQTLSQVSRIKYDLSKCRRYAAFIATISHAFDDPIQEPTGV